MKTVLYFMFFMSSTILAGDSFQVLRDDAEGFSKVVPGKLIDFPADHGMHPDYRIEWWYLTANLMDDQGNHWGLQWTLFRQSLSAIQIEQGWSNNQLWMAHGAISTPEGHQFEQRFARGGIGQAGVSLAPHFEAWIDDWVWQAETNSLFPAQLQFRIADKQVNMQLSSNADLVLHGDEGYSQKSQQGQASYYYSQPQIQINGTINGTQLSGAAWLDREWSSQPLAPNQSGWDWFSLHLNDGYKLMLYQLRHDDGQHWLSGSWVDGVGKVQHLTKDDIELKVLDKREIKTSEETTHQLPLEWQIKLPTLYRNWTVRALYDQQWMDARFPYWEGVVLVKDEKGDETGVGYMELTGYK